MRLAATTSLSTLAVLIASPALAQTRTSTSGDVTNASGATLAPTSGAAITIDSNNSVTNAGAISQTDVSGVTGIATSGSRTGAITNSGSISLTETYAATDTNGDSVVDAPFAQGSDRYGIRLGSDGTFTGAILSSGTITIKGNNSAALYADAPIVGNVTSSGAITVTGDNSYGVRLGAVTGNVAIVGGTAVTGAGSEAVSLNGAIVGQVVLRGGISATGYTSTTLPATLTSLTAGNLLQGGPAVRIGGSVSGGVLIGGTPTTTDTTDADGDGIADSAETTATILSYGSAPAVLVGSASAPVTLGAFGSTGQGLVVNGTVGAYGVYAGYNATALQIGGLGQTVSITGGIGIAGSVTASANTAHADAIHFYSGATTPALTVSGAVSAFGSTASGASANAILIDSGASLGGIANSGTIQSNVGFAGGRANAILDQSGTLATITNTGTISATDVDGGARAIDVSAGTGAFSYTQSQSTTSTALPTLTGAIVTGSGPATISASAGTVKSAVSFGGGNATLALSGTAAFTGSTAFTGSGNRLSLADTASYSGSADFGGGAGTLSIAGSGLFAGTLANAGAAAVTMSGGTLALSGNASIASLSLAGGALGVTINPVTGAATQLNVSGATTIGAGASVKLTVSSLSLATQNYTVLTSGSLAGSGNLTLTSTTLPYLMTGAVTGNDTAGTVAVSIQRKSAAALGLNRSESAAYDAVYAAILSNTSLNSLFTGLTDGASTLSRYRQMLPDHDGGLFDLVSSGVRALSPGEGAVPLGQISGVGIWAQQAYWDARQKSDDTGGYKGSGWGLTGGGDVALGGFGRAGLSLGYLYGHVNDTPRVSATANQFQGGVHWIANFAGFSVSAYGVGGIDHFSSERAIDSISTTNPILLSTKGHWSGSYVGGGGKASYELKLGGFYLRPAGGVTYARMHERAHDEAGGGAGFDLSIAARTSDEFAATGTLAAGYQLGGDAQDPDAIAWRFELEGGRRQVIGGSVGATTAHFAGGQDFTLIGDKRTSGYTGSASASVGNQSFRFVASAVSETRDGYRTIGGRIGVRGYF